MEDEKKFRKNVAAIIINDNKKILICEHKWIDGVWQIPQGGQDTNESEEEAILRELNEELGNKKFKIIKKMDEKIKYVIPPKIREKFKKNNLYGQIQTFFLIHFYGDDKDIRFDNQKKPEFKNFMWVDLDVPIEKVIYFKKISYFKSINFFKKYIKDFNCK